MTEKKIVKLDFCNSVRELWEKEDLEFTPWLEKNIEYLNEVLDFEITIQEREVAQSEGLKTDLLGSDRENNKVIIENQFGKTDHKHLGQILVYAITMDAKKAIWISEDVRQSHIDVIEWLNEKSPDDMGFYLIRIKVGKLENKYIPIFEVVVRPTPESKIIGKSKKEYNETQMLYNEFWTQFLEKSSEKIQVFSGRDPSKMYNEQFLNVGGVCDIGGVTISPNFTKKELRNEIYISTGDREKNKKLYETLAAEKDGIEEKIHNSNNSKYPFVIQWHKLEGKDASRLRLTIEDFNAYERQNWDFAYSFLIESSSWLEKIANTYL